MWSDRACRGLVESNGSCQDDLVTATEQPTRWDRFLLVVVGIVATYAFGLVVAGLFLGDHVFDRLGFGPYDGAIVRADARHYVRLVYVILGSVIIGWMLTIAALVAGPLRRREVWAWNTIVGSVGAWFILDTGLSLILGFAGHAAFNVAFAAGLAVPLVAIRQELGDRTDKPTR